MFFELLTADPMLSRVDASSLTDQTRMEILISGLDENCRAYFCDDNGDFMHACRWLGVTCTPPVNGSITRINWNDEDTFAGELNLSFLPTILKYFGVEKHPMLGVKRGFNGSLETSALPLCLDTLTLGNNDFSSTVNFTALPKSLTGLFLAMNQFFGSADLTRLPKNLTDIDISMNQFSGEICLDTLPQELSAINISGNSFIGRLNLEQLPLGLIFFDCSSNSLSGSIFVDSLPPGLLNFNIAENNFSDGISSELLTKNRMN